MTEVALAQTNLIINTIGVGLPTGIMWSHVITKTAGYYCVILANVVLELKSHTLAVLVKNYQTMMWCTYFLYPDDYIIGPF